MFETAELEHKVSKSEFEAQVPTLRLELLQVQQQLKEADFPVLVLIHGVEGGGKGDTLNLLHEWMDARYLQTYAVGHRTEEERERPRLWRFWMAMPPKGQVGLFVGSWYTAPMLHAAIDGGNDAELDAHLGRINSLEKALVDDGALVIKLWFHLSRDQQRKRFKKLEKNPDTRWRVSKRDWQYAEAYGALRRVWERTLRQTSTGEAPWTVIAGANARYRHLTCARHLVQRISEHIEDRRGRARTDAGDPPLITKPITILDKLDLDKSFEKDDYERKLEKWQGRLNLLSRAAQEQKVGAIAVFEGWDAGGKGGCIRRITKALDARYYRIIPIAAPTDEERAHHYLWRFWRHLPRTGSLTIYDRSWYGRVLVERVEGYATVAEWMRAYHEINDFEEQLSEYGIVLCKFWLHLSPEEQLRRFKEREQKPWKRYKITAEDYRNRDKWSAYEAAADDMIERTSTEFAPWTLVEAQSKRYARIKVLKTLCASLKAALR
ncbi:polyphosphate:AMP phosphotransferase [Haliangium sp.]|uniref:polyphosphate:AMP phosphotransferase n=1 Tax=Haliangium sp. TaxID=2663208 RepID=UPI003D0D0D51